jgi:aerobic carbon-monoxide dehydrogenase medium subunit
MYPNDFEYAAPSTLQEALDLLSQNSEAKVLAGGHSLLPLVKMRLASPPMLVDLRNISELKGVRVNGGVSIGAMSTYHDLQMADGLRERLPMLVECAENVGDPQVRNCGTIGGSLAHADPAADMPAAVLALGAELKVRGPNGERTIKADDFFVDMLQSALEPGEILTEITVPSMPQGHGAAYEKFKHPASGYAVVGVAAMVHRDGGKIAACRIAVTGAGPKAQRATMAENMLVDRQGTAEDIAAAAEQASSGLDFIGDTYASEDFRAHLTRALAKRALQRAIERAG